MHFARDACSSMVPRRFPFSSGTSSYSALSRIRSRACAPQSPWPALHEVSFSRRARTAARDSSFWHGVRSIHRRCPASSMSSFSPGNLLQDKMSLRPPPCCAAYPAASRRIWPRISSSLMRRTASPHAPIEGPPRLPLQQVLRQVPLGGRGELRQHLLACDCLCWYSRRRFKSNQPLAHCRGNERRTGAGIGVISGSRRLLISLTSNVACTVLPRSASSATCRKA